MANYFLPYGYIDRFDNVDFNTAYMKPLMCRLKGTRTARIITLGNGRAFNITGDFVAPIFPVEQQLEILIHGVIAGDGSMINAVLDTIAAKSGMTAALRVRIPHSSIAPVAQAVFDYLEIVEDGQMDDTAVINWSIVRLYFQQLELFHV